MQCLRLLCCRLSIISVCCPCCNSAVVCCLLLVVLVVCEEGRHERGGRDQRGGLRRRQRLCMCRWEQHRIVWCLAPRWRMAVESPQSPRARMQRVRLRRVHPSQHLQVFLFLLLVVRIRRLTRIGLRCQTGQVQALEERAVEGGGSHRGG